MKLSSIIKNRKAMTPLMIGIIVAASVLAVFFIVMAATIPLFGRDLNMTLAENSIHGNITDNVHLSFKIICDYEAGSLTKVEIYRNVTMFGDFTLVAYNNDSEISFLKNQGHVVTYNFTVDVLYTPLPPEGETAEGLLIFGLHIQYTLRIYYENDSGTIDEYKDFVFTFQE
ncbi:MAG: hypothetical protein FK732_09160 [Asgard group archaeon]|nr:hypothetical protein [Asgard group archaeon]